MLRLAPHKLQQILGFIYGGFDTDKALLEFQAPAW